MNLRKQLSSYIALNNYVEAIRSSQLPAGYTELEYIESTGTQYIDTRIANWNNTLEYEIKLSIKQQLGIKTYFGCYEEWINTKDNVPSLSTWTSYKVPSNFRAGNPKDSGTDIGIRNGQTGTISLKGNTISWSEGSSTSFDRGYDFTVPFSIFLFAQHAGNNGATEFATTKIYRAKFWLNGELIRDLRPMLDYNNVACMFDMVTGKCFYNQGTGTFIPGPEVYKSSIVLTDAITNGLTDLQLKGSEVKNKPEVFLDSVVAKGGTELRLPPIERYDVLEYLESTGTQYIDTGYKLSSADEVKAKAKFISISIGSSYIFGAYGNGANFGINSNGTNFAVWGSSSVSFTPTMIKDTIYDIDMKLGSLTINGTAASYTPSGTFTNTTKSAYLFWANGTTQPKSPVAIYSFQIINNGTIIQNLIPCRRKSDGVLGMYDKVSGTFLTNAGTGEFVAGAVIDTFSVHLPAEYTQLDYIESSGTQYIDTGVVLGQDYTNTNIKLEYDALINSGGAQWQVCGTLGTDGIYIGVNHLDIIYYGTGFDDISTGVTNPFVKCKYINDAKNGVIKVTNLLTNTDIVNQTYNPITKTTVLPMILFSFSTSATTISPYKMSGKMYNAKIYNNNELIRHFIPAKRLSDSVIGMYDTVTGQFFTNAGTGEFTAGPEVVPTPDTPIDITSNNGVLKVSPNLFDKNASYALFTGYINNVSVGENTTLMAYSGGDKTIIIKVAPNTTYTVTRVTNLGSVYDRIRCAAFTTLPVHNSAGVILCNYMNTTQANATFTTLSDTQYVAINVRNSGAVGDDWTQFVDAFQLEQGSTATQYRPYGQIYTDGTVETIKDSLNNTATAEMLLKVGNYQDEQEILSGAVTRNVGIKVLDGTEDWAKGQSFYCNTLTGVAQTDHSCYCTHYQGIMNTSAVVTDSNTCRVGYHIGSDIAWDRLYIYADRSLYATAQDFANYLADQYAAGTPVIVVYPLNASTTETVSPQKLFKNPVTVTEASIDNLEVTTTEAEHTVPTPDYPLDIACNNGVLKVGSDNSVIVEGTPETVTVTGKNLFNESHIKSVAINDISVVIPVKQNKTYTWSYNKTEYDFRFDSEFIWGVDLNGNRVENGVTLVYTNGTYTTASYVTVTVVSPNVVALQTVFRNNTIQSTKENVLASSMQLEEGIRPTKYEEYYQASFAPEDLLKLGDYQDVQSVLDGIVTRNVGVKVLTGASDEQWGTSVSTKFYWDTDFASTLDYSPTLCTYYQAVLTDRTAGVGNNQIALFSNLGKGRIVICDPRFTTVEQFRQFLADQYAAGTPVIVVYPLANTVEETVESRDVFITSGTNTVERNSEYVSSDGITVKYKKLR